MSLSIHEIKTYKRIDELAEDVIALAKAVLPDKVIYINALNDVTQVTLKVSKNNTKVTLKEGTTIPVEDAICNLIDYKKGVPLVYNDISKTNDLKKVQGTVDSINANAYLGIPISLSNGERFGSLCAADDQASVFDEHSILLLQKIAKMFTYYLELEYLAYRDYLTGLYNRHYLFNYFEDNAALGGTLILLDLDGFKRINDTFGHEAGDQVLIEFANKLQSFKLGIKDAYAVRLGGDEFVLHLPHMKDIKTLESFAKMVLKDLKEWESPMGSFQLTTSMGILVYPENTKESLSELLNKADSALYEAKADGRNTFKIYK